MLICDSESDSFKHESTKIWVICAYDTEEDIYYFSFDDSVYNEFDIGDLIEEEGFRDYGTFTYLSHGAMLSMMERHTICFHNYFQHDKPLMKKFYPQFQPKGEADSYILSQLYNPDRGLHGLAAWGDRFKVPKPEHEEWDKFSPEMLHRVIEDVKINVLTWNKLEQEKLKWEAKDENWDLATKIENGVADIQGRQEMHGVLFDEERGYALAEEIWNEVFKVSEQLQRGMPLRLIREKRAKYEDEPFTQSGRLTAAVLRWFNNEETVSGPFTRVGYEETNLNSPTQIKAFLLTQGWIPDEWTPKGSPKLTESSYPSIRGELGQLVSKRAVLKHRAQMLFNVNKNGELKGLLNLVRDDGRIEAGAMTNGTNTGRMTHRGLVNIPKPKDRGLWPSEVQIRELFVVPEGTLMMGVDADGLEARMEAHACYKYEGGEEYAHELIDGDVHSNNMILFETATRDDAKAPKYALTYGCSVPKLANTLGCSEKKARILFDNFWRGNTALDGFKKAITAFWKSTGRQYIIGIDGRKIFTRSEHSLVNAYFQSTGSIVVKVAAMYLDKWCRERNLKAQQIIIYHDELEYEVPYEEKDIVEQLAKEAFKQAGRFLKIRVPVTGTPKWGLNWKEVH